MKPARLYLRPKDDFRAAASLDGAQPELLQGLAVALRVFGESGLERMVVTYGTDGQHKATSLHPKGLAADLRTHDVRSAGRDPIDLRDRLAQALGRDWDVILEFPNGVNEHVHLEFDPKPQKASV